jgi:hypothetical protein
MIKWTRFGSMKMTVMIFVFREITSGFEQAASSVDIYIDQLPILIFPGFYLIYFITIDFFNADMALLKSSKRSIRKRWR